MTAPPLFLDVDGVLNAVPARRGLPRRFASLYERVEAVAFAGQTFPVHYRPTVVEELNRIVAEGLVAPVWLTSWGWHAAAHLAPAIGLRGDNWPVLEIPIGAGVTPEGPARHPVRGRVWWKTEAVLDRTGDGRPFLWLDDDLHRDVKVAVRKLRPQPSLMLTPFEAVGLTGEHMVAIEAFAREQAGRR